MNMWITRPRQDSYSVTNLENGHYLGVRHVDDTRGVRTWEIVSNIPVPGVQSQTVMDGYLTYEDAEAALKDLLTHFDIDPFETDDPTVVPAADEEGK